jgi:hypothetical protein
MAIVKSTTMGLTRRKKVNLRDIKCDKVTVIVKLHKTKHKFDLRQISISVYL